MTEKLRPKWFMTIVNTIYRPLVPEAAAITTKTTKKSVKENKSTIHIIKIINKLIKTSAKLEQCIKN